jgi:hypothetical protein
MNTPFKGKWDGLAALVWMGALVVLVWPTPASRWLWLHLPRFFSSGNFSFVFWVYCWWPPVLVLAVSGLWRGNLFSKICAVPAICLAVGVEMIILLGNGGL